MSLCWPAHEKYLSGKFQGFGDELHIRHQLGPVWFLKNTHTHTFFSQCNISHLQISLILFIWRQISSRYKSTFVKSSLKKLSWPAWQTLNEQDAFRGLGHVVVIECSAERWLRGSHMHFGSRHFILCHLVATELSYSWVRKTTQTRLIWVAFWCNTVPLNHLQTSCDKLFLQRPSCNWKV